MMNHRTFHPIFCVCNANGGAICCEEGSETAWVWEDKTLLPQSDVTHLEWYGPLLLARGRRCVLADVQEVEKSYGD
jgi:hypothetical protein